MFSSAQICATVDALHSLEGQPPCLLRFLRYHKELVNERELYSKKLKITFDTRMKLIKEGCSLEESYKTLRLELFPLMVQRFYWEQKFMRLPFHDRKIGLALPREKFHDIRTEIKP